MKEEHIFNDFNEFANFLQDRIDTHRKHGWMLNSITKSTVNENIDLYEALSKSQKRLFRDLEKIQQRKKPWPTVPTPAERQKTKQEEMSKSARMIKDIYKKKRTKKEELVEQEKMDKSYNPKNPEDKPSAQKILTGGKTDTGSPRDDVEFNPGDVIEFNAPGGAQYAGVLQSINDKGAWFDFNHPLAGREVTFEAQIVAIL